MARSANTSGTRFWGALNRIRTVLSFKPTIVETAAKSVRRG